MQATSSLFALSTFLPLLVAQSAAPPIPVELRARFGFDGPLIAKVGDGIASLRIGDVDGDGRLEAVVADARRARLVVVRVDGSTTKIDSIPTSGQIGGHALADVHGDGKPDLLLVDGRGHLSVRHPGSERADAPLDLGLGGRGLALLTGDLDGDGKHDLVAVGRGKLRWVTRLADTPVLSAIEPLDENAHSFHLADFDGDDRLDLCCVVPTPAMNLRLRLGRGDGTFGPWRISGNEALHGVFPARLADGSKGLATIQGPQRRVTLQKFGDHGEQQALEWWSLGDNPSPKALPFASGDVDGDGDLDVLVAQPELARLMVFEWRSGTFVPRAVPSLAGLASIACGDVDGDGKADLVFTSPEEETLAWKPATAPLDTFPVQIACTDRPIAATPDPNGGILVIARNEKRDAHLDRVVPGKEPERLVDLGRLPADPVRLIASDIGDAPGLEVSFVVPGEGLRTVTIGAEAKKAGKSETAGFTKKLDDGALAACTFDGKPALLAVRERFLRRFRVDEKGQVRVLAQDNGPEGLGELTLATEMTDGWHLWFDKKANKLVRTRDGSAPLAVELPPLDFTHLLAHGDAAVLLSARGLLRVPFGNGRSLRAVAIHEPPIERTAYWTGEQGDFDHDGIADLVLIDGHLPGVQILAGGKDGLARALAVPVFEAPPSGEPDSEPRDLATGDLDGDGRTDFALIAHDRVLIYLQEK